MSWHLPTLKWVNHRHPLMDRAIFVMNFWKLMNIPIAVRWDTSIKINLLNPNSNCLHLSSHALHFHMLVGGTTTMPISLNDRNDGIPNVFFLDFHRSTALSLRKTCHWGEWRRMWSHCDFTAQRDGSWMGNQWILGILGCFCWVPKVEEPCVGGVLFVASLPMIAGPSRPSFASFVSIFNSMGWYFNFAGRSTHAAFWWLNLPKSSIIRRSAVRIASVWVFPGERCTAPVWVPENPWISYGVSARFVMEWFTRFPCNPLDIYIYILDSSQFKNDPLDSSHPLESIQNAKTFTRKYRSTEWPIWSGHGRLRMTGNQQTYITST